ncbi:DUF4906 domain-containing protein [Parabacteroides gordonii]|uniref:DUF4906 domain-containing protein n=1 Tax=Parabacteroides gordonii TaxID=574930 RepID=UPI0026EF0C5E|nr:DUF4906 domain-containing protein [Parabacteroides gordonii]
MNETRCNLQTGIFRIRLLPVGIFICLLPLFTNGCTQAEVEKEDSSSNTLRDVEVNFELEVKANETPVTRSITFTTDSSIDTDTLTSCASDPLQTKAAVELPAEQEKKVAGLWIGQYDTDGNWLFSQYIESVTGNKVTTKLKESADCHVWFISNSGDLGKIETETALKEHQLNYTSTADGRPASNLCAMKGMWEGTISKGTTEPISVELTRLLAKITFTYTIRKNDFSFTPVAVNLKSVVNKSQIEEPVAQLTTNVAYKDYPGVVSPEGAIMYWYLPENMAGSPPDDQKVLSEKEKIGNGINNATYVELIGDAVQNGVEYKHVIYRFYPGKDANDYNITRNSHYIMNINLAGIDLSDKRITIGVIPPIEVPPGKLPAEKGGEKEVQVTARPGQIWFFQLPSWLSAQVDGQQVSAGSGLTGQGPAKITFRTEEVNPNAEDRSVDFTVKLQNTDTAFRITQAGSDLNISDNIIEFDNVASSATIKITGTNGLPWTITRTVDNSNDRISAATTEGITPQDLIITAKKNGYIARSATFTITGGNHTKTVTVNQVTGPPILLTIDESTLKSYYPAMKLQGNYTWNSHPPFDYKSYNTSASHGLSNVHLTTTPTMTGSYTFQVQKQNGNNGADGTYSAVSSYCDKLDEDGFRDWRLPTMIELHAICNNIEVIKQTMDVSFTTGWMWSDSYWAGKSDHRCRLNVSTGNMKNYFSYVKTANTWQPQKVRCVRDVTLPLKKSNYRHQ